jgi:hypothetical protein
MAVSASESNLDSPSRYTGRVVVRERQGGI